MPGAESDCNCSLMNYVSYVNCPSFPGSWSGSAIGSAFPPASQLVRRLVTYLQTDELEQDGHVVWLLAEIDTVNSGLLQRKFPCTTVVYCSWWYCLVI